MAAARETKEAVSSGGETKSGNKTDSGLNSRDTTEAANNQAEPRDATGSQPRINGDGDGSTSSLPSAESPKTPANGEPSLGKTLAAARERRGVSRADVAREARIPPHYLEMIENSDYDLISDQLYLMPFLRRYAAFLKLDGEEIAMRFMREVQRAEGAAVPRMSEPLALHDRKSVPWGRVAMVIIVLSAIVVLYVIVSRHHRGDFGLHQSTPPAAPAAPTMAIPPAAVAPASPPAAPAPPVAPAPKAVAPAQLPEAAVGSAATAPANARPLKVSPSRAASPADSNNE